MDIKLSESLLRQYLDTPASLARIAELLTLAGPTVDRISKAGKDWVLEIEVITNRVDMASAVGIAREAAAILPEFGEKALLVNDPYRLPLPPLVPGKNGLPLNIQIMDQSLVKRFAAIVLDGVRVTPSDKETVALLEKSGERSLNNVVDVSNELTLRLGQPVHIFDYDKLVDHKLVLRESKKGETVTTLDGVKRTLPGRDIVIADGSGKLVDLCGIMGGQLSKVDETTRRIVLFVQTYEPKHIRRTSLFVQNRTLAAQLFEKSPDPELVLPTLYIGVKLLGERAGAKIASRLYDIYPETPKPKPLKLELEWLGRLAGIKPEATRVRAILERLGFAVSGDKTLKVVPPSWRVSDVKLREDLAEEVLRVTGYFRLPPQLPATQLPLVEADPLLTLEKKIKSYLAAAGYTEVYNYSLVDERSLSQANLSAERAVRLTNPLSGEYTHLRSSLTPSMLATLALNQGQAEADLFFELANVYLDWDGKSLPREVSTLILAGLRQDYRQLKGKVETLLAFLRTGRVDFVRAQRPYLEGVKVLVQEREVGYLGMVKPEVADRFGLPVLPLVELDLVALAPLAFGPVQYRPLSPYPAVVEDITLDTPLTVSQILTRLETSDPLLVRSTYLGSFGQKHTFRLEFQAEGHNLTKDEVAVVKAKIFKLF